MLFTKSHLDKQTNKLLFFLAELQPDQSVSLLDLHHPERLFTFHFFPRPAGEVVRTAEVI